MQFLKSDTVKTILKLAALLLAALAGTYQQSNALVFGLLSGVGLAFQAATVSGVTLPDLIKAAYKLGSQICTTVGTAVLVGHPQLAAFLLALGTGLLALTVKAPGTAAQLEAARGAVIGGVAFPGD